MKKSIITLACALLAAITVGAQNADKAKAVLDKTAALVGNKGGASAHFTMTGNKAGTIAGDIAIKGINPGPVTLAILPAGGFITLGLLLALINRIGEWNARRHGAPAPLPVNLDCRHCTMCGRGKEGDAEGAKS